MKHSEMLQIIKDVWMNSSSFPTDNSVADYILKQIEAAGMLPPNSKCCFCHDCECLPIHKWEKEK